MKIAKLMKHRWEEEPISGIAKGYDGTFAIFFYGCNMRCVYCQNSKISRYKTDDFFKNIKVSKPDKYNDDKKCIDEFVSKNEMPQKIEYSIEELSEKILKMQNENVASVSFITGVLYVDEIVETIKLVKSKGLKLPIVYNSSGYETESQIKKLDGLIDIYLPDFKYHNNELGKKYSGVPNYTDVAKKCIAEMYRQVGERMIVRHLVLPANTENSKLVLKYLYETYGDNICISIMSQYTPMPDNENIKNFPELLRKLTKREYEKVVDYAIGLGIKNAFIQEGDVAKESFIPEFT